MNLKIVTLVAAIGALIFLSVPLTSIIKTVNIKKNGVLTQGTVINKSLSGKGLPTVTVSFNTPDGTEITGTATKRQYVSRGDKVNVWYYPAFPQKINFGDTIGYNMRGVVISGLLFIFCFFYFIRYTFKDRANNKLISSGMKIAAEFSIERNERYRMGDKNPWVIKCRWIDSRNNQEYYFASKDYIIDPGPYLEGKHYIDVYVDPANPRKYYMDTSFMPKGNNTIG